MPTATHLISSLSIPLLAIALGCFSGCERDQNEPPDPQAGAPESNEEATGGEGAAAPASPDQTEVMLPTGPMHEWDGELGSAMPEYGAASVPDAAAMSLVDLRGQPLLLNFWATWCVPCRLEFPELTELHDRLGGFGLQVVGVSLDQHMTAQELEAFASEHDIGYPIWHDPEASAEALFGVPPLPGNFVFDEEGRLVFSAIGAPEGTLAQIMAIAETVAAQPVD